MRDQIWKATTEAKFTQIYAELTCQNYKRISSIVNIITTVFSGGGVIMKASFWQTGNVFPFISCIIITLVQSLRLVAPKLFPTDKEYKKYNDLIAFYFGHHNELHELWHEFDKDEIKETVARKRYFKITAKEKTILSTVNEILTDDNMKRIRKAEKATRQFFNV